MATAWVTFLIDLTGDERPRRTYAMVPTADRGGRWALDKTGAATYPITYLY